MTKVRKADDSAEVNGVIQHLPIGQAKAVERGEVESGDCAGTTANGCDQNPALNIVEDAPDASAERVAALRQQIADGTYAPDPREVARAILQRGL